MGLEDRVRRLEKVIQPKDQVFTTKFCDRCGWTERDTPPGFKGRVIHILDFRHCPYQTSASATLNTTPEPVT